jgi:phosphoenolpyruvate-protein kinase (PTS system EI component)
MAANPIELGLGLGLGFRSVSVPVSVVPLARAVIRNVDLKRAQSVAEEALRCESADEVRKLLDEHLAKHLDPLWKASDL